MEENKKNQNCGYMDVKTRQGVEKIPLGRVLYFSSNARVVEAHMDKGQVFRFYGKLDDVQEELGETEWLRCHKSYLVRRKYIRKIAREYLIVGREQVAMSRNYYVKLRDMGLVGRDKDKIQAIATNEQQKMGILHFVGGRYEGRSYYIYPNEKLVLGRGYNQADLVFDEPEISRVHCWVQYNAVTDHYYISNQSINGIYINDELLEEHDSIREVKQGDRIRLAKTEECFEIG